MDEILGWHNGKYTFGDESANELREKWGAWMQHGVDERREKIEEISARLNSGKVKDNKKQEVEKELENLKEEQKSISKLQNDGFFNKNHSLEDWKKLDIFTRTNDYTNLQEDILAKESDKKDPVKRIQKSLDELKKGSLDNIQKDQTRIAQALKNQRNGMEFEKVKNVLEDKNLLDENGKIDYNKNKSNFLKQNQKEEGAKGNVINSDEKARKKKEDANNLIKIRTDYAKPLGQIPVSSHLKDQIKNSKLSSNKPVNNPQNLNSPDNQKPNSPYQNNKKTEDKKKKNGKNEKKEAKEENQKNLNDRLKDFWDATSTLRKWSIRLSVILLLLSIFFQLIYGLIAVLTAYCDEDSAYWEVMKEKLGLEKDAHVTDILVGTTDFDKVKMAGFDEDQTTELTEKASNVLAGDRLDDTKDSDDPINQKYKNEANEKEYAKMVLNILVRAVVLDSEGSSNVFIDGFNKINKNNIESIINRLENKKDRTEQEEKDLQSARDSLNGVQKTSANFLEDPLTFAIGIFIDVIWLASLVADVISVFSIVATIVVPGVGLIAGAALQAAKGIMQATTKKLIIEVAKREFKDFIKKNFKKVLKQILKNLVKNWRRKLLSLTGKILAATGIARSIGHFLGKQLLNINFIRDSLTNGAKFLLKKIGADFMVNWGADNPQWKSLLDAICNGFSVETEAAPGCGEGFVSSGKTFEAGGFNVEAPEFIPNNKNLFYALIGITGKESGGKLSAAGDRDSVGPYQQRVNEYMDGQGEMGTAAKQVLGSKFDEIFTPENKAFITSTNAATPNGRNIVEYGPKMREIAQKLIDGGGRKLFDQIQIARFKYKKAYETIVNYDLNKDTVPAFASLIFASHGVGEPEGWVPTFIKIVQDGIAQGIHAKLNNSSQSNSTECKSPEGIGALKPDAFMVPTTGIITRCKQHPGGRDVCDIADPSRPPVYASREGKVIIAFFDCPQIGSYPNTCGGGFGRHVKIQHADGWTTIYGHLYEIKVQAGQQVNQGDQIGIMGTSGNSTGIHLHFEIRTPEGIQKTCDTLGWGSDCNQGVKVSPKS